MSGCPPVHTQHKESMLCHTKGVSICPHTFGCPCMFGCQICVDTLLYVWKHPKYVWMPPVCLDTLLCLDDVWMPPEHTQHKESMLCHTKGVSLCTRHLDAPICLDTPPVCLDAPYVWTHPLYVWMPPYVWIVPCMFECPHV